MVDTRRAISTTLAMAVLVAALNIPAWAGQTPVVNGGDLFRSYCVACHGADAKRTGPLANSLSKRPADLTSLARRPMAVNSLPRWSGASSTGGIR